MALNLNIRHLESTDLAQITAIYHDTSVTQNTSQLPYLSSEKVASFFANQGDYTLVAEYEGKAIGHISLLLSQKMRDKHCATIALAVDSHFHGKGVGKALMSAALDQADNWMNIVRLELDVQVDNLPAVALYKKMGFKIEGEKKFSTFSAGKYTNLYLMARIRPNFTG
ncbi:GNAT family N-acetyltransferase [Thalassotalea sp. PLHSN55]|uniref:GNAT family N-acetyltransferase n=1 Tax=Thalassotalea sp. PLHSN55 TaxID=3435888 RepID=UPI003F84D12C